MSVTINSPVAGVPPIPDIWTTEVNFVDTTTQSGSPIDTPKTILFGAGGTSGAGIISCDSAGIFTLLKGGPLFIKNRFRVGRTSSTGVSHIFIWAEASFNAGSTWTVLGNPIATTLDAAADSQVVFDGAFVNLPKTTLLRQRFARSSTGSDFGDLVPLTSSASLITYGIATAPSAQTTVYKATGYSYT